MNRLAALALALVLAFASGAGIGWVKGRAALQARLDAQTIQAQAAALETSKALAVAEQARRTISAQLDEAANAQPVTSPACLPVERVRRLNLR